MLLYLLPPCLSFFCHVSSVRVIVQVCVCSERCQESVETHRWSGWFPLSEIWVRARSQISGLHSWSTTHRFLGRPGSDTEVLFCFVTEPHTHPWYHIVSASSWKQACHLCVHLTFVLVLIVRAYNLSIHCESSGKGELAVCPKCTCKYKFKC